MIRGIGLAVLVIAGPATADAADRAHVEAIESCAAEHLPDLHAAEAACIGLVSGPCTATAEGQTTLGMNECHAAESAAWDVLLNRDWPVLMAHMRRLDEGNGVAGLGLPSAARLLREAQRAWLAWRDVECRQRRSEWGSGTLGSNIETACWLQLTAERMLELRARRLDAETMR